VSTIDDLSPLERQRAEVLEAMQELVRRYARDKVLFPETARRVLESEEPLSVGAEFARIFGVGPVRRNAAWCGHCDVEVESVHRHDFRVCPCGAVAVDGGTWYCRRQVRQPNLGYEERSTSWPWSLAEAA